MKPIRRKLSLSAAKYGAKASATKEKEVYFNILDR